MDTICARPSDNKVMKTVKAYLQGGLGNQCFIYAAARAVALRTGAELVLDGSYFLDDRIYRRTYALDVFKTSNFKLQTSNSRLQVFLHHLRYVLLRDRVSRVGNYVCDKRPFKFRPLPDSLHGTLTLDGYFQSEKYFYDQRKQMLKDFTLKDDSWLVSDRHAQEIAKAEHSIFLHVRSYKEVPGKDGGECALRMAQFYLGALERLRAEIGRGTVYVFSDDIEWTKVEFLPRWQERFPRFEFKAVGGESSQLRDFTLMRMCKHGIVADSSFSWWAGWLGEQKRLAKGEKPLRMRVNRRVMNDDFWPERWVAIDES